MSDTFNFFCVRKGTKPSEFARELEGSLDSFSPTSKPGVFLRNGMFYIMEETSEHLIFTPYHGNEPESILLGTSKHE
jgi:hypothetical protein